MTGVEYKTYENRVRRAAERQGLRLEKSRRRDPRAVDYGTYRLVDPATNTVTLSMPSGFGLSLTEVDRELAAGTVMGYEVAADFIDYDNEAEARGESR